MGKKKTKKKQVTKKSKKKAAAAPREVSLADLFEAKQLVNRLGGADKAKKAIDALGQLQG